MKLVILPKIFIAIILLTFVLSNNTENKGTSSNSLESKEKNELNLNHGIFLNQKLFKSKAATAKKATIKKSKAKNKTSKSNLSSANKSKNNPSSTSGSNTPQNNKNNSNSKSMDLSGPILNQGWIKYFKYSGKNGQKMNVSGFKENEQFYEQRKFFPNVDLKEKKNGNFEYIRDKEYFFFSLFESVLSINSSLHFKERKVIDLFSIYDISEVYEDSKDNKENGILEYGKFNEGYCLKISLRDQYRNIYTICLDTLDEKNHLFNILRGLKLKDQHDHGIYKYLNGLSDKKHGETLSDIFNNGKKKIEKGGNVPVDGYWILLQDWSQCSKKCDTGTSTYQRMCVPPKKGGKPCPGKPILVKQCNRQPCPKVTGTQEDLRNRNNTEVMKPIIKILPFSKKPQRFTLCKIKESDMMIFEDGKDPIKQNDPLFRGKDIDQIGGIRIPSRVIMNLKTLTVYSGDHFDTLYSSFLLEKTKFYKVKNRKNCFKLIETASRFITLCPYNSDISSKETDEWENDFFTFRDKCSREDKDGLSRKEKEELEQKIKDEMNKAKQNAIDEANESKRAKRRENEVNEISNMVQKTNKVAMKAIEKESNIEDMIKQEAEEKNRNEEIRLKKMIEDEKNKQKCVAKAIKEKELENQLAEKAKEIKETIETIKTEAAAAVLNKRTKLKKMIDKINKKAELRRNQLRQQLQQARMSTANQVKTAYKKGDTGKCMKANKDPKHRNDYCIATFSDDFAQLDFCRKTDDFCETCCEAEFGEMFSSEKEECKKKVCPKDDPKKDPKKDTKDDKDDDTDDIREISNNRAKGFIKQRAIKID